MNDPEHKHPEDAKTTGMSHPKARPLTLESPWDGEIPQNPGEAHECLKKLTPNEQLTCAQIAVDLVLPRWTARFPNDNRPAVAVDTVARWRIGQSVGAKQLQEASNRASTAYHESPDDPVFSVADAAAGLASIASRMAAGHPDATKSLHYVIHDAAVSHRNEQSFFFTWWTACWQKIARDSQGTHVQPDTSLKDAGPNPFQATIHIKTSRFSRSLLVFLIALAGTIGFLFVWNPPMQTLSWLICVAVCAVAGVLYGKNQ